MNRRISLALVTIVIVAAFLAGAADTAVAQATSTGSGQAYPTRPVRLIVAYPPGGGGDTVARIIGQKLFEAWGQQIVVDNRPGGGANIGAELAAHAAPDGYTLFMPALVHTVNATLYPKLGYDIRRDFAYVILLSSVPNILAVHPSVPARTTGEFIKYAKTKPGQLNYASTGSGGPQHLGMELFKRLAGLDMTHIPYKGGAPALTDLLSGQVQVALSNMIPTLPHTRSGRLRALAVTSAKRSQAAPELPTIAESGLPGFEAASWFGFAAPARTPRPIIAKINAEVNRILELPEIRSRLGGEGAELVGGTPEAFTAYVHSEVDKWAKVVKVAKLSVD
ncbi:MAG: tripartite tricarboxylate transporter substrate binding protein [Betaproteobacteria bacterium]|nr:tripartite tricarboxylate transporter substrate binding protein [Betaproteobacteria bacterium]